MDHVLDQPAERIDAKLDPSPPGEPVWTSPLGQRSLGSPSTATVTGVPGWDVVVGYDPHDRAVVAISLEDGSCRPLDPGPVGWRRSAHAR